MQSTHTRSFSILLVITAPLFETQFAGQSTGRQVSYPQQENDLAGRIGDGTTQHTDMLFQRDETVKWLNETNHHRWTMPRGAINSHPLFRRRSGSAPSDFKC